MGQLRAWLDGRLPIRAATSDALYDRMASQSGRSLVGVYQPVDSESFGHWIDRGQILDFAQSVGRGHILDLGPGDGWPSLGIAPLVESVVGVDASQRRVQVCRENADRMAITNATFVHVPARKALPFADAHFDGIVAASSVEQTPDPCQSLAELYRVLKPGGMLRMSYEGLTRYAGHEHEFWSMQAGDLAMLIECERDIAGQQVAHTAITFHTDIDRVSACVIDEGRSVEARMLEPLLPLVQGCVSWRTLHPSCATWLKWLDGVGFAEATATYCGATAAAVLYQEEPRSSKGMPVQALDALLAPSVNVVRRLEAPVYSQPGGRDPWITACKVANCFK